MEYRITISPDPTRIVNKAQKRSYLACTTKEQYRILKKGILDAIETMHLSSDNPIEIQTTLYFEQNSSGCLHVHGDIKFIHPDQDYNPKIIFQRMILRTLGREFLKGNPTTYLNACCDMQNTPWSDQIHLDSNKYRSWLDYCLKDQTDNHIKAYPPIRYKTNTIESLTQLLNLTEQYTPEYGRIEKQIKLLNQRLRGLA